MPWVLIRSKVKDYAAWKPVFDGDAENRKAAGSKGGYIFQTDGSPNEVTVFIQTDSLDAARKFTSSDELRQAMEKAGVLGPPEITYLNDAGQFSA